MKTCLSSVVGEKHGHAHILSMKTCLSSVIGDKHGHALYVDMS